MAVGVTKAMLGGVVVGTKRDEEGAGMWHVWGDGAEMGCEDAM